MLADAPLISVVLPCYNHGKFLKQAISSVFSNCSRSLELLVINDGSTDQTLKELVPFVNDPRITIINQDNIGLAESLNKGFNLAKGQYLSWTSADNLYKNFALDKLSSFLENNPDIDFVYSDVELIDENSKLFLNSNYRIANQDPQTSSTLRLPREPDTLALYSDNFINACFMYRSWIPKVLGGYKKELLGFEDYEYWLRILTTGKISHLGTDDVLYQYRVHEQSLTGQLNAEKLCKEQREVVAHYGKLIREKIYSINHELNKKQKLSVENQAIDDFLHSLPLRYTHLDSNVQIQAPRILLRVRGANYRCYELLPGTKASMTLLLPDFLLEKDLIYFSNLIASKQELTFVCLCCNQTQAKLAKILNEQIVSKNFAIIDLTNSPVPADNLLPEEVYLPFVYALATSSGIICPTYNNDIVARAISALAEITKIQCILIGEKQISDFTLS